MSAKKKNTKVTITAISAAVIVVFLFLFTEVQVDFNAPFVQFKLAGKAAGVKTWVAIALILAAVLMFLLRFNGIRPGINATGLDAGGKIRVHDKGGQGVDVENAKAKGDITLVNEAPSGDTPDPKP